MKKKVLNATENGGAVVNKKTKLEIVKVIENPMAELETLDEREQSIIRVMKNSINSLMDIPQMRMFNEKEKGRMVGAHVLMPVIVKGGIFPIELVKIGNGLNATVAVCHDDVTEQMAVIISW